MAKMTEAQKRAALKYQKTLGQISIRLPQDELQHYKDAAKKAGMPFRAWVLKCLKKGVVAIAITGAVLFSLGADNGDQQLIEDSYTVQKGDTLWSISETYLKKNTGGRRYILEFQEGIKELNPWLLDTKGQVQPGDVLRINYWVERTR